jgi:surfactin synthase thioesterase subunit
MTSKEAEHWLRRCGAAPGTRARLLCLPYAGGGWTVYTDWDRMVPKHVEVRAAQLPARQDRLGERGLTRIETIVERLAAALGALAPAPLVLLGHSMGGLVAYELARALEAAGRPARALVVGGLAPPSTLPRDTPIHRLQGRAFLDALHRRFGTPRALLDNEDLMELALPSLRADLEAFETYIGRTGTPPLGAPITVLRGSRDPRTRAEDAAAWGELTSAGVTMHAVEDSHFFVTSSRAWVGERVAAVLAGLAA